MDSQSNLDEEKLGQEARPPLDSNLSKINQSADPQSISENIAPENIEDNVNVFEVDFVESRKLSEDSSLPSEGDPLANLFSLINDLDVDDNLLPSNADSLTSDLDKPEPIFLPKFAQNDASSNEASSNENEQDLCSQEQSLVLSEPESNGKNVKSNGLNSNQLVNSSREDNPSSQASPADFDEASIVADLEAQDLETTSPESSDPAKLEYTDEIYYRNYIDQVIPPDSTPVLDSDLSLLNPNSADSDLRSPPLASYHWIVQKERRIHDLATSINSLLPLVVELSQAQVNSTQEHILKNLVPIIDQVIQKRSTEDQQKMAEAIANILPKAIQQEIQQEPKLIGQAIAPELALSITEQIRLDDDAIAEALGSEMGKAIKNQIAREREAMVDALYPVIGSTISKYMAEVVESINEKVDNALSPKGIQRKFRAKLQGVSEAELILQESFPYRVKAVFLIQNNSGLVIAEFQPQQESQLESDLLAGMLTAIRSFANDCIASNSELDEIDYGNFKIMFETAGYCYLAVVVIGEADRHFRDHIRAIFTNIVRQYGDEIEDYQGDQDNAFATFIKTKLEETQTENSQESSSKSPKTLYRLVGSLILLILIPWGILHYRHSWRRNIENKVAIQLDANPELSVYRLEPKIKKRKLLIQGRVPTQYLANLATHVTVPLAQEAELELDNQIVPIKIPPDPNLTEQEVQRVVGIINQNSLDQKAVPFINASYADQTVTINGLFLAATKQRQLVKNFRAIPGVDNVIFVISNDLPQLDTRIYFASGVTTLSSSQKQTKLEEVLLFLKKYPSLKLKIISHGDNVGSIAINLKFGKARADNTYQNLINRGIEPERLEVVLTTQPPPDIIEGQSVKVNRCIRFEVFGINSN